MVKIPIVKFCLEIYNETDFNIFKFVNNLKIITRPKNGEKVNNLLNYFFKINTTDHHW